MLGNKKPGNLVLSALSCRKVCYYIRYEMALAFADGEQKSEAFLNKSCSIVRLIEGEISMRKKELALEVIRRLKEEYPDADCTLDYDEAWKLLVSVRLAAQVYRCEGQCSCRRSLCKISRCNALADAPVEEIEEIVRPCGLGKSKARDISACMKILRDEYNGKVPDDFDKLLKLPGVGRKSANLIMGDVFGKPAIVTDTHCIRLCNRIGLVDKMKDPKKVEMALWKIIPPEEGNSFCHRLVNHGREVLYSQNKTFIAINAAFRTFVRKWM